MNLFRNNQFTINIDRIIEIILLLILTIVTLNLYKEVKQVEKITNHFTIKIPPTYQELVNKEPLDGIMEALIAFDVPCKQVVYQQAMIESGRFQSKNAIENNNYLGIMYNGKLRHFDNWVDCILYYKLVVSSRYTGKDRDNEAYYQFLTDIKYAEDTAYISKLRSIEFY